MAIVLPVKFQYAMHDLWFDPADTGAAAGDHVICSTERGTEIGLATMDAFEVPEEELGDTIGDAALREVVRIASDDDLERADLLAQKGEDALPTFRSFVKDSGLEMKPVGVEYLFGGEKVVCYFAAEDRVDFRQLVRDLSRELGERIDMRQIGVREEAAIVGGYGHCGQELCCSRIGHQFEPVTIRMAKEQDLPLNSNKISGACGRLMCCLRYEFEAYRDFKGRAPKKNAVIDTPLGKAKIIEYDTPKEQLCLRIENGKTVRVPLSEMVASEAAHRKSEELGCPCRPDTVTREMLDKLTSPEIQMALAELDRINGVIPDELDSPDIFVSPERRKRRARISSQQATLEAELEASQAKAEKGAEQPTRTRRRRRKSQGEKTDAPEAQAAPAQPAATQEGTGAEGQRTSHRRRHHRTPTEGTPMHPSAPRSQAAAEGEQAKKPKHKRTRRPGDKGGVKAEAKPAHERHATHAASANASDAAAKAADPTQKTRKKRRRGRRGGSGGQQGGAPGGDE